MSARNFLSHSVVEYLRSRERSAEEISLSNPSIEADDHALMLCGVALVESTPEGLSAAITHGRQMGMSRIQLEECALQSYLFLGFPRMITALEILSQVWPDGNTTKSERVDLTALAPSSEQLQQHWEDGVEQCGVIYGKKFNDLASYMYTVSPTLLTWMIQEGYGKVLSRPGLQLSSRELLNVSMLLLEERERQLYAHLRGAMNAGVEPERLIQFSELHTPFSSAGTAMATGIVRRLISR